jgi:hypothetical protein
MYMQYMQYMTYMSYNITMALTLHHRRNNNKIAPPGGYIGRSV